MITETQNLNDREGSLDLLSMLEPSILVPLAIETMVSISAGPRMDFGKPINKK